MNERCMYCGTNIIFSMVENVCTACAGNSIAKHALKAGFESLTALRDAAPEEPCSEEEIEQARRALEELK